MGELTHAMKIAVHTLEDIRDVSADPDMINRAKAALAAIKAEGATRPRTEGRGEPVAEPEMIERLLDAQQDINLAANTYMDHSLCDASALIDEIEPVLRHAILNLAPVGGRGEEWRPISEAPRDGSPILAASANHEAREVVCWQDGEDSGSLEDGAVCEGWVNAGEQKDRFYANPRWFTHWQPLPPPPQEQGGMR